MDLSSAWRDDLAAARGASKVSFDSAGSVGNPAHARAAIALLAAFAADDDARLYAEPRTPQRLDTQNARPTDLLLLHPDVGALLFEVKGWRAASIQDVEAGTFTLSSGETQNPWQQVQAAAAQLQTAVRNVVKRRRLSKTVVPFFEWMVVLPFVSRRAWNDLDLDGCIQGAEILLQDDLCHPDLREHVVQRVQRKAGRRLPCTTDALDHVREALGSSHVIRKRNYRSKSLPGVAAYADQDHQLSEEQVSLIEAEFDGRPQLIRGVAGSGKTTVLVRNCARLVARLEASHAAANQPARRVPRVAFVCFNRALVPFVARQFDESYAEVTRRGKPEADVWVGNYNRLMYALSHKQGGPLEYQPWTDDADCLHRIAANYLKQVQRVPDRVLSPHLFDAIYVDEGQDLLDDEYRVLMHLLRRDPVSRNASIVIAYDDAQNVYGRPRPTWKDLGIELRGRSHAMRTCFRNTKETVEFGLNVLLGAAAEKRALTRGFADTGYLKENGLLQELPDRWLAHFARRTGPPPQVELFATRSKEREWVLSRVRSLLAAGTAPEDILLLFHGAEQSVGQFAPVALALEQGLAGVGVLRVWGEQVVPGSRTSVKDSLVFQPGHITIGTLQSLKGQDASFVFLMGADLFALTPEHRAAFYVGATRAKTQVFVSGVEGKDSLADEAADVLHLLASAMISTGHSADAQHYGASYDRA